MKTVKVSSKGQVTLPVEAMRALHVKKGTEFLLVQQGDRIVLVKAESAAKRVVDDLGGWEALGLSSFAELWDNEADEVWNDV